MREHHRLRIRRNSRFPAQGCSEEPRIDLQQQHIGASSKKPVCWQVHLLTCGQVDKPHFRQ